jgi:ubiquinone/menaquinone biosynthesis C-methylase UbiE
MIQWNKHYNRSKSSLSFPDENLVRLIMKNEFSKDSIWLDCGTGSGRHLQLLDNLGFKNNIGTDISLNGLKMAKYNEEKNLIVADNRKMPFPDNFFHGIIAWGSLHYNHKDHFPIMINEIHRILKTNGRLFATLRSQFDTHMKKGKDLGNNVWLTDLSDIEGSIASFFSEEEIKKYFSGFSTVTIGLMERSLMGDLETKISHWIIDAVK